MRGRRQQTKAPLVHHPTSLSHCCQSFIFLSSPFAAHHQLLLLGLTHVVFQSTAAAYTAGRPPFRRLIGRTHCGIPSQDGLYEGSDPGEYFIPSASTPELPPAELIHLSSFGFQYISDLRACRVRELEEKRINREMAHIRQKFKGRRCLLGVAPPRSRSARM